MGLLYGRAGRLTALFGDFRPEQRQFKLRHGVLMGTGLGILFFFYFYMAASGLASGAITDDDL